MQQQKKKKNIIFDITLVNPELPTTTLQKDWVKNL